MSSKLQNASYVAQPQMLSTGAVWLIWYNLSASMGSQMAAFCITDSSESGCLALAARAKLLGALLSRAPEQTGPDPNWVWCTSTEAFLEPSETYFKHCVMA